MALSLEKNILSNSNSLNSLFKKKKSDISNSNLYLSQKINNSSPNLLKKINLRSKSQINGKHKIKKILSDDYFKEKITTKFEEKGATPTQFTKYLVSKFKGVVENYEKLDIDEQIKINQLKNRKKSGKNNIFNSKKIDLNRNLNLTNSSKSYNSIKSLNSINLKKNIKKESKKNIELNI